MGNAESALNPQQSKLNCFPESVLHLMRPLIIIIIIIIVLQCIQINTTDEISFLIKS